MTQKFTSILCSLTLLISPQLYAQNFTNYTTADGLPDNNVLCLAADNSNNMWFGTQNGVAMFNGSSWAIYNQTSHPALPHNTITAIAVDANNGVWIGTDFGASYWNGTSWTTFTTSDGLGNDRINYITVVSNGDVWFSEFSGATVYRSSTFTAYNSTDGLPFGGINCIDEDSKGDIWMGSGLGGLIHFDGTSTFTAYKEVDGLLNDVVRSVAIDANDTKWVGTGSGISVFDSTNALVNNYTKMLILPPPDTLNPVEDVKVNSQGDVWVGIYVDYLVTEGGMAFFDHSQWSDYHVSDGLISPVIRKIAVDNNDDVWVATSGGVSKMSFGPSSVMQTTSPRALTIHPNPASNRITVKLNQHNLKNQKLEIYNATMQLVKQYSIRSEMASIELSIEGLKHGVYIVRQGNTSTKLVVN